MPDSVRCPVCLEGQSAHYTQLDGYPFFRCGTCNSIHLAAAILAEIDSGRSIVREYDAAYWDMELKAARHRAAGEALSRAGEAILYCRRPVHRFLDLGAGPGYLLQMLLRHLDASGEIFHAVEMFPPKGHFQHANYHIGSATDLSGRFDAGVCIEVVEHLTPTMLRELARSLACVSEPGAYWLFNTGMDGYVEHEDPGYLDPVRRGHIVSYSIPGLKQIFGPWGFDVHALPGKSFAFAAEFGPPSGLGYDERIYRPLPENLDLLQRSPLLHIAAFETARSYLYFQEFNERSAWANSLDQELKRLRGA